LQPHVAEFATQLADVAKKYPFQWFNFFPFWDKTFATKSTP
jgi:predicted LPLAT superfamily acyltransferase